MTAYVTNIFFKVSASATLRFCEEENLDVFLFFFFFLLLLLFFFSCKFNVSVVKTINLIQCFFVFFLLLFFFCFVFVLFFLFVCLLFFFFSSPAHEELKVSYCDRSMPVMRRPSCVVHRAASTICFKSLLLLYPWGNWLETWWEALGWLVDRKKKVKKSFLSETPWRLSWKFIFRFFLTKRPTTWNLARSIGSTCKSKIVKIISIGNPRWASWWPFWKSIFRYFS